MLKDILADILEKSSKDIREGKCSLDDDELLDLASMFSHRKINIDQTCRLYHLTRQRLDYKIKTGEFPTPYKDPGSNKYFWKDEIDKFLINKNKDESR